jgi:hypothetical protein
MSITLETHDHTGSPTSELRVTDVSRRAGPRVVLPAVGLALAAVLLVLGAVMRDNARFAEDYVARQLGEQRIRFAPVEALAPEERATPCLVANAGKPLTTGPQAECYANFFIGRHLKLVAGGKTFSELRGVQTALRSQVAEAQAKNDPKLADLQRQLNEVNAKRQTLFEGESMRGLLLTSYGFSTLGAKAGQAATVAFFSAGLLLPVSLGFLARGLRQRRTGSSEARPHQSPIT